VATESDWQLWYDDALPKLRSPHWDAQKIRLDMNQIFCSMFLNKASAPGIRWVSKKVDELARAGEKRTIERLGYHLRTGLLRLESERPTVARLLAKLAPSSLAGPKTNYVFRREGSYLLADVARLRDKRQFLAAAKSYLGTGFRTPGAFFVALGKDLEEPADEIEVVRWRIARKDQPKKPLYEMWTFLVDNGAVFEIGSAKPAGVHAVQGLFEPTDRVAEHRQLAEDLQRAVPF
jgi:hypothetical protein